MSGLGIVAKNPCGSGPGIYFFEALAAAALQSPRIQLFSLGILNSMEPPEKAKTRGREDQRTKYDMARHMEDKHGVGSACRPNT